MIRNVVIGDWDLGFGKKQFGKDFLFFYVFEYFPDGSKLVIFVKNNSYNIGKGLMSLKSGLTKHMLILKRN